MRGVVAGLCLAGTGGHSIPLRANEAATSSINSSIGAPIGAGWTGEVARPHTQAKYVTAYCHPHFPSTSGGWNPVKDKETKKSPQL